MIVNCVWEHNGKDTLLYAVDYIGAYTRGENLEIAKAKIPQEMASYCKWLGVDADNDGNIYECRKRGFEALEKQPDFLQNTVIEGSYGEDWSLRKVLRRFIWHDRIHAKAMYRMAVKVFAVEDVVNPFFF